jgi:hypothetical protein
MKPRPIFFVCAVACSGCYAEPDLSYPCKSDASCIVNGVQGECVSAGTLSYCAMPLTSCSSGFRWDDSAPAEIRGNCVGTPLSECASMGGVCIANAANAICPNGTMAAPHGAHQTSQFGCFATLSSGGICCVPN